VQLSALNFSCFSRARINMIIGKAISLYALLAVLALLLSGTISANEFDLFNADRGKPPPPPVQVEAPPPPPPPPEPPKAPALQKDFILRGTQIIGHRRSVTLETPNGKRVQLTLRNTAPTVITGFPGYVLHSIEPRAVRLSYPQDAPCSESRTEKGVECVSATEVLLTLQRGKPTPPKLTPAIAPPVAPVVPIAPVPPPPPGTTAAPGQAQFQPRIIKDEEIPPGMKRIRTPFGDRLVPAN
jgi:hypothetical protein